ncbi:MAG TPA: mechanosensitive ion channel domain-containing protein, partial [Alcanivoracaceae bacterium]|nr:mechanosensitive ion channel domain-containing protein [Alcanivoracaceae bacterium]
NLVQWRIAPVKPAHANKLLTAIGTVFGLLTISFAFMTIAWKFEQLTPALESVFYLFQTTIMAFAIAWLFTPKYWTPSVDASQEYGTAEEDSEAESKEEAHANEELSERAESKPLWLKAIRVVRVLIMLAPLLTIAGYGRFVFHFQSRLLFTIGVVGITILLRLVLKESLEQLFLGRKRRRKGRWAERQDPESDVKIMVYWTGLLINLLLLIPVGYILLWSYGVPPITLKLWTQSLLAGITIGNITISLTDIITALVMLIIGLFITSMVRRWMTNSLLPNTRLDSGARDSIAAGTGYVGVFIAIIISVVALGIDFSSLALVAGALSVGIGFGLQNLVQNFAAGIMLLIERPIKVGDMIVVDGEFGEVRRISVRATEVETYDRSTIFIPNSDLIANNLINWSHNSRHARLRMPVHTAYGSDPKIVEKVLLECANAHPNVLWYPASYVWFRGFANGVQNYELRVYINDVDNWVVVNHDVYVNIEEAFRQHNIEIPVPPREIFVNHRTKVDRGELDELLLPEGEHSAASLTKPTGGPPVDKPRVRKAPGGIDTGGGLGGDGAR